MFLFPRVGGPKQVQLASPPLSLTAFVEEYSKQLPLQLKVLRGYCGPSSRLTSEWYNFTSSGAIVSTVQPLNKGCFGTSHFVLYREVDLRRLKMYRESTDLYSCVIFLYSPIFFVFEVFIWQIHYGTTVLY